MKIPSPEEIEKMPLDQKRRIVAWIKKRAEILKEQNLDNFVSNPGAQDRFLRSQARIRAMFGGNGLSKTTSAVIDLIWSHLGVHPHRDSRGVQHTWFIVPSYEKVTDYWEEIKKWCPPSQLPKTDKLGSANIRRLTWPNGTITTFFSHEQDSMKLEGSNISGAYFDEPPPRALWIAVYRGLRANKDYFICITATPISEPWLYEELYLKWELGTDPNIEVFTGSSYENIHVPKEFIDDFASRLTEEEREVRIHGKFALVQGRVFSEFRRKTHVLQYQQWPSDWPVWVCIDPHKRKPHTAVWVGVTPDENYVVIDEISVPGPLSDLADDIKMKNIGRNVIKVYCDNQGNEQDWNRDAAIEILRREGIPVEPVSKDDKKIDSGIMKLKQLISGRWIGGERVPQLRVMENCIKTITEFEMYVWNENKHPEKTGVSEKPRKNYDDFLDPLRYLVNKTLTYAHGHHDEPIELTKSAAVPYQKIW